MTSARMPGFRPSFLDIAFVICDSPCSTAQTDFRPDPGKWQSIPFRLQHFRGGENVVTPERDRLKLPDALLVTLGGKKRDARLRARNEKLNPALLVSERLVGGDFQSEPLSVKIQRHILIANWYAYELYSSNHRFLLEVSAE
jgi:hypothetical protein